MSADRADFGRLVGKVPARRVGAALERLLDFYVARGGTSHAFWADVPLAELRALLADIAAIDDATATEDDFIDHGEAQPFEVIAGEGECAA